MSLARLPNRGRLHTPRPVLRPGGSPRHDVSHPPNAVGGASYPARGMPPETTPPLPRRRRLLPQHSPPEGPLGPALRSLVLLPVSSCPQDSSRRLRLSRSGNPREAVFRGEGKSLLRGAEEGAGCRRLERRRTREVGGRGGEGGERSGAPASAAPAKRQRGRPVPIPGGGVRG